MSRTCSLPASTRTGNVTTSSYAGGVNTLPVLIEKCAPWRGQNDLIALHRPAGEDAAVMRTDIFNGVELAIEIEDSDLGPINVDRAPCPDGKLT